jgi:hypothetical protein
MRFMVIGKANKDTEAGNPPNEHAFASMNKFIEELAQAGVLLDGAGLMPSSKGVRVKFEGAKRTVIDGPFAEAKELIAGFMIWQCKSLAEAIEWAKRSPDSDAAEGEVEIRQMFELGDFPEVPDEVRATQARLESTRK